MNQDFMLKADTMMVTTKSVGQQHELNTRLNSKDEERQAFSSELNKQIDKQERPKNETPSRPKQSQSDDVEAKGEDVDKRQVDETENKDGNTLPDEHSVESETSVQATDESLKSQIVSEVLEPDLELEPELKPEQSVQQVSVSSAPIVNIVAEQAKQTELNVDEKTINADARKAVQAGSKSSKQETAALNLDSEQSIDDPDQKSQILLRPKLNNIENKRIIDIAAQSQVADNKQELQSEPNKVSAKIRPDILNALAKNQQDGSEKSASALNKEQSVVMTNKVAANVLSEGRQVAEAINQVKPGLQVAGKTADHGVGSLVAALTPAAMTQGVTTPIAPTASTSQASLDIQPSVQSEAWNRVLSSRVIWMAREGIQRAELKLNPANLGPVEVRLNMHNDQANVTFIAHHAATRDALEQALPRLRDSFMENGFELTDAEVSQHDFGQDSDNENENDNASSSGSTLTENDDSEAMVMDISHDDDAGLSIYA